MRWTFEFRAHLANGSKVDWDKSGKWFDTRDLALLAALDWAKVWLENDWGSIEIRCVRLADA